MEAKMLKSYLKKIFEVADQGDAREESYYATLGGLLNEFAESCGNKNIHITTLPKKTAAGNPDFRIWDGKQHIVVIKKSSIMFMPFFMPMSTVQNTQNF
jgi:hypothetical protein